MNYENNCRTLALWCIEDYFKRHQIAKSKFKRFGKKKKTETMELILEAFMGQLHVTDIARMRLKFNSISALLDECMSIYLQ